MTAGSRNRKSNNNLTLQLQTEINIRTVLRRQEHENVTLLSKRVSRLKTNFSLRGLKMHEQSKENFYVDALQETSKTSCKKRAEWARTKNGNGQFILENLSSRDSVSSNEWLI